MKARRKITAIEPKLGDLLKTPAALAHYEDATAALEAADLVRSFRADAIGRDGKRGITQVELAERLGISQARVSEIERGDGRDGPTYGLLRRIARQCGVDWPQNVSSNLPQLSGEIALDEVFAVADVAQSPLENAAGRVGLREESAESYRIVPDQTPMIKGDDEAIGPILRWAAEIVERGDDTPVRLRVVTALNERNLAKVIEEYHNALLIEEIASQVMER